MVDLGDLNPLTGDELRELLTAQDVLDQVTADDMHVAVVYDPYTEVWHCVMGTHPELLPIDGTGHEGATMALAIIAAAIAAGFTPGR